MHTYPIGYAACGSAKQALGEDYIHARRYMPGEPRDVRSIDFRPKPTRTGLFETAVPHRITVIKKAPSLRALPGGLPEDCAVRVEAIRISEKREFDPGAGPVRSGAAEVRGAATGSRGVSAPRPGPRRSSG